VRNIYDPSAIINLCAKKNLDRLLEGETLDLAVYEAGNAVWRQVHLRKTLTREEGEKALTVLTETINNMKTAAIQDTTAVLNIAIEEGITFYDASYLHAAVKNNLTLVTDDERLSSAARRYVKTAFSNRAPE
jgi:predicted nucleic acid-binding protein